MPGITKPNCLSKEFCTQTIGGFLNSYEKSKSPIEVSFRSLIPELSRTDRATHLIHPYPAKLLVHIPYLFLNNELFSEKSNTIFDPFCGSGTVLLESILADKNAIGVDNNPLARLISSVKTSWYDTECLKIEAQLLRNRIRFIPRIKSKNFIDVNYWFLPDIQNSLLAIYDSIQEISDKTIQNFFLICFSSIIKKVSLADSRISVPVKLKDKQHLEKNYKHLTTRLSDLKKINVLEKFFSIVNDNIIRTENFNRIRKKTFKAKILNSNAKNLTVKSSRQSLKDNSVDLVLTSPPYAGAQKYIRASSLSLEWIPAICNGSNLRELESNSIGREYYKKEHYKELRETGVPAADILLKEIYQINPLRAHIASNYLLEMATSLKEAIRVLKPSGHIILIVGNNTVCGKEFQTQDYLRTIAETAGLSTVLRLIDDIQSYGLMTKRNKTASIITREWVLVLKKD